MAAVTTEQQTAHTPGPWGIRVNAARQLHHDGKLLVARATGAQS